MLGNARDVGASPRCSRKSRPRCVPSCFSPSRQQPLRLAFNVSISRRLLTETLTRFISCAHRPVFGVVETYPHTHSNVLRVCKVLLYLCLPHEQSEIPSECCSDLRARPHLFRRQGRNTPVTACRTPPFVCATDVVEWTARVLHFQHWPFVFWIPSHGHLRPTIPARCSGE